MKAQELDLARFNAAVDAGVAGQSLNFCRAVALSYDRNMSVTACPVKRGEGEEFVTLDENLNPTYSASWQDYYYGVSPLLDSHMIITALSELRFSTREGLDRFISEHGSLFMLHPDQKEYLADFARHTVVTLASKYGLRLRLSEAVFSRLRELDPYGELLREEKEVDTPEEEHLLLCGCPTPAMLEVLAPCRFVCCDEIWEQVASGVPLTAVYADIKNVTLLCGNVFYSGVLLKPLRICRPEERFENFKLKNLCLEFERSSFAAVCTLDEVHLRHPLLAESAEGLSAMFYADDACKRALCTALAPQRELGEEQVWEAVNDYLQKCLNVNQIGVTANIVTGDGRLLLGVRKRKNIDTGQLYPGVNGNAEIKDERVAFYAYSVYEDEPTVDLLSRRKDFLAEIAREAYAELRLEFNKNWQCYGLILSGQYPPKEEAGLYPAKSRRMHFNVIFEKCCEQTHEELEVGKAKATEAFETGSFLGLRVCCYRHWGDWLLQSAVSLFKVILNNKELVESLALFLVIFVTAFFRGERQAMGWLDWLSYLFAALITLLTAVRVVQFLRSRFIFSKNGIRRRYATATVRIFCNHPYSTVAKKLDRALNGRPYHPAAYAATRQYLENKIYDLLTRDEKEK